MKFWISGWNRKEYELIPNSAMTVFVTLENPGKPEAFEVQTTNGNSGDVNAILEKLDTIIGELGNIESNTNRQFD